MGDQMLYHNEDIGMGLLNYAWFHASVDVLFVGIVFDRRHIQMVVLQNVFSYVQSGLTWMKRPFRRLRSCALIRWYESVLCATLRRRGGQNVWCSRCSGKAWILYLVPRELKQGGVMVRES